VWAGVEPIHVDPGRMLRHFRTGVANLRDLWARVIASEVLSALETAAASDDASSHLDDEVWVHIVYDIAAAYHHRTLDRDQLIRSILPLYLGRVASFVREVEDLDAPAVEALLERLCLRFESAKPYLVQRWQSPLARR